MNTQAQQGTSAATQDRGTKLAAGVRLLWSERWWIVRVTTLASLAAVALALVLPPRYESTVRLLPASPANASLLGDATRIAKGETSALAGLAGLAAGPGNTGRFVALLRSRTIADRIIDRFGLMKLYGARLREDARLALQERTVIVDDRKTGVISVTVADKDRHRAAQLATAYVQELDRLNAELNTSGAHQERLFLEKRVEEVKDDLAASAARLSQFSSKSAVVDLQEQPKAMLEATTKLQAELAAARAELAGLEQIYTSQHPRLITGRAKVAELSRQVNKMSGSNGNAPDGEWPSLKALPALGVTYSELFRRTKLLELVHTALTQQLEIAKTEEAKQLPVVKVLDAAEVPERRTAPRRTLLVLTLTAISFLGCCAFVVLRQQWEVVAPQNPLKALAIDAVEGLRQNRSKLSWSRARREQLTEVGHHHDPE